MAEQDSFSRDVTQAMVDALNAWVAFKKGHDLESARITCCDTTKAFHDSMDALHKIVLEEAKEARDG